MGNINNIFIFQYISKNFILLGFFNLALKNFVNNFGNKIGRLKRKVVERDFNIVYHWIYHEKVY
jgi:hypothetical protein